jgi:hypothetical protein
MSSKGKKRASRQARKREGHAEAEECREKTRQGHSGQDKLVKARQETWGRAT